MARVIIAVDVPIGDGEDDFDSTFSIAMCADTHIGSDATVWQWDDFWDDVADGVLDRKHDSTAAVSLVKAAKGGSSWTGSTT